MRKGFSMFLAGLLTFTISATPAWAAEASQTAAPAPPQLYSATAVLMDADTGQTVWSKNKNTKMFPASLTKVITCLLAMERGNPADTVTMTDEGVFSVPRYSTHAALTPGEQLTLEQLEYVMMVESANDAANGVAIHLAGSIPAFAAMMNEEAARIGAVGTHFTNANGLPDPDHYTTAYDLALFTREALKHPAFRSLAGTQSYEVPPTNLQPQSRKFNNRQYMFCLNDTYPGAFAGKTGWTDESGKTLITIAERNGITLIAVVMKPTGAVDGEFKDSTALLDYGFDNFSRVTIPKSKALSLIAADTYTLDADMPVLLPLGATESDVTVEADVGGTSVRLIAPKFADSMDTDAGVFALTKVVAPAAPVEPPKKEPWSLHLTFPPWLLTALMRVGIALVAVAVLLLGVRFCVRRAVNMRNERRRRELEARRKRARTRAALQLAREQAARAGIAIVDVRLDKNRKNRITIVRDDKW